MKWLRLCKAGGHYTLLECCHNHAASNPHPAKFDPMQKHAEHRRELKGLQQQN